MMKFPLRLRDGEAAPPEVNYESTVTRAAESAPGVKYRILRLSFARRMELARRVLELARKAEFHDAGGSAENSIQAHVLASEIDQTYLRWGLVGITGLTIDGAPATPDLLAEEGPESLAREIVQAIKSECGLNSEERKN